MGKSKFRPGAECFVPRLPQTQVLSTLLPGLLTPPRYHHHHRYYQRNHRQNHHRHHHHSQHHQHLHCDHFSNHGNSITTMIITITNNVQVLFSSGPTLTIKPLAPNSKPLSWQVIVKIQLKSFDQLETWNSVFFVVFVSVIVIVLIRQNAQRYFLF